MRVIFFIVFLIIGAGQLSAQVPDFQKNQALELLQKKGLDEEDFRKRLSARGIDIEKVDVTNPTEVANARQAVEAVVSEMEAEQKEAASKSPDEALKVSDGDPKQEEANNSDAKENAEPLPENETSANNSEKGGNGQRESSIKNEASKLAQESAAEIQEAVEEGASVQEAIAEELVEQTQEGLRKSKIYGQHIFRNQSIKVYRNSTDFSPPPGYILGPGDKINISIWGVSQADFSFEVDNAGFIYPTGLPRIYLKGITLESAKDKVRSVLSKFYRFRPEEYDLAVSTARTITVNFFGETTSYGSFTLPAVNTAFNALVAAGGPSDIGSVRRIRLIRGNKTQEIDAYKFMIDPTVQFDFFLENNDIIFIPIAEKLVNISGAVNRPYTYELKNEEQLSDLIKFAGGLKVNAYKKNIQIVRLVDEVETIIDLNLKDLIDNNRDFELKNGDKVNIREVSKSYENFVAVSGAVEFPGQYSFFEGMKIYDLIEKGVLEEDSRLDYAFLQREKEDGSTEYVRLNITSILNSPTSEDNIALTPRDKLTVYRLSRYVDNATVSIAGAVRKPGNFPYDPNQSLRLEDLILISGGLRKNATDFAYIQRVDSTNNDLKEFLRVNVRKAMSDRASYDNILLRPFDKVRIYTNETFTDEATVSVLGSVRSPDEFPYSDNLKISDVIYMSDGLTLDAADFGYVERSNPQNLKEKEFIRLNIRELISNPQSVENILLKPFDKVRIYSNEKFTDVANISISGSVRSPNEFPYSDNLKIRDVIYMSDGLTPDAANFGYVERSNPQNLKEKEYIRLNIRELISNPLSGENITVAPFDKINIYSTTAYTDEFEVSISGAVRTPGAFKYSPSLTLKDVLTFSGGFKLEAAKNRIEVFRVLIKENTPTETQVASFGVDPDFNIISGDVNFQLFPFDKIVVREVPDFELQQFVTVKGEINFPGEYALLGKNEKISSLIERAGGLTLEAFPEGATLMRKENNIGSVILKMDKAMKRKSHRFNYILKPGDVIEIPKVQEIVSIEGVTKIHDLYPDKFIEGSEKINVAYHSSRRASFYVRKFAGGIDRKNRGAKKLITVEHPNGQIKKTINLGIVKITPKVRPGSAIKVGQLPPKPEPVEKEEREPVNWQELASSTIAQVTSILTLLLLINRL